jgi:hypothetical protein
VVPCWKGAVPTLPHNDTAVTPALYATSEATPQWTDYRVTLVQRGLTTLSMSGMDRPPQDAGDQIDAGWGGDKKAHTNDPTPVSADNNSLGKKGAIGQGESFEEYMKKRAAQGK